MTFYFIIISHTFFPQCFEFISHNKLVTVKVKILQNYTKLHTVALRWIKLRWNQDERKVFLGDWKISLGWFFYETLMKMKEVMHLLCFIIPPLYPCFSETWLWRPFSLTPNGDMDLFFRSKINRRSFRFVLKGNRLQQRAKNQCGAKFIFACNAFLMALKGQFSGNESFKKSHCFAFWNVRSVRS